MIWIVRDIQEHDGWRIVSVWDAEDKARKSALEYVNQENERIASYHAHFESKRPLELLEPSDKYPNSWNRGHQWVDFTGYELNAVVPYPYA